MQNAILGIITNQILQERLIQGDQLLLECVYLDKYLILCQIWQNIVKNSIETIWFEIFATKFLPFLNIWCFSLIISRSYFTLQILRAWISQGFRPFYIIYESLHNNESIRNTNRLLLRSGYTYLTKRGWNYLFEYNLESDWYLHNDNEIMYFIFIYYGWSCLILLFHLFWPKKKLPNA